MYGHGQNRASHGPMKIGYSVGLSTKEVNDSLLI